MAGMMMLPTGRVEVLKVIKGAVADPKPFILLYNHSCGKDRKFSILEFLQSLPTNQYSQLCESLFILCRETVLKIVIEDGEDSVIIDGDPDVVFSVLNGIVTWIHTCITDLDKPVINSDIIGIVAALHGILLSVSDLSPDLQNKISLLCEAWWAGQFDSAEEFVPNTILYIVIKSLSEGSKVSHIKRVWSMRAALLLLDFEDVSANSLKEMLLMTTISPLYLKNDEGCKFISYLFGLHPSFVTELHQIIKYQLPGVPRWLVDVYGKVYYRAWRLAEGPYLTQLENHCVQDLMYSAVHATRNNNSTLFNTLRKLLSHFHEQSNQRQVQDMLNRLYKPFLWRSLRVANDYVRANAVTLMMDAFPLVDPNASKEDVDSEMQRQVDLMKELLMDPAIIVRVTTTVGVCRILSCYWEMLPLHLIKDFLIILISELAFDAASSNVRVSVIQGICVLLEERLSHPVLQDLLPSLGGHLHDVSERVRLALLDLLILIKGMRSIKFWSICSVDHLLARMEIDTPHVVKRIVVLLMDALRPSNQSSHLQRCIVLLRSNPNAARRFYKEVLHHTSPKDILKFIITVFQCVRNTIKHDNISDTSNHTYINREIVHSSVSNEIDLDNKEEDLEGEDNVIDEDQEILISLLEVVVILMEGFRTQFDETLKEKLLSEVSDILPDLVEYFEDNKAQHVLYRLSSFLPKNSSVTLSKGSIDVLLAQQPGEDNEPILTALILGWSQGNIVIKQVKRGLDIGLGNGEKENRVHVGRRRKDKSMCVSHWPVKSLEIFNSLMIHPLLYDEVKHIHEFRVIKDTLKKSMINIEQEIVRGDSGVSSSRGFLIECFSAYVRMLMHEKAEFDQDLEEPLSEVLIWCERIILDHISSSKEGNCRKKPKTRKRKSDQSEPINNSSHSTAEMAQSIVQNLLTLLSDVLICGLCSGSMDTFITQFTINLLDKVDLQSSWSHLFNLLHQLIEYCNNTREDDDDMGMACLSTRLRPPANLLERILILCVSIAETKNGIFCKIWSNLKPVISNGLVISLRHSSLSLPNSTLPIYITIAKSILYAQNVHIRKDVMTRLPSDVDELPLLVKNLINITGKDKISSRLLFSHMEHVLEDNEENEDTLLSHISSLHISNALANISHVSHDLIHLVKASNRLILTNKREIFSTQYPDVFHLMENMYEQVHQTLLTV